MNSQKFNYQQLEILKDLIVEKLSKNEALDQTTRTHLGDMLTEIKEELKVLEAGLVDELNDKSIHDEVMEKLEEIRWYGLSDADKQRDLINNK